MPERESGFPKPSPSPVLFFHPLQLHSDETFVIGNRPFSAPPKKNPVQPEHKPVVKRKKKSKKK